MPRITPEMAEAIAQSLENSVKMVNFFERYDKEHKELQQRVEQNLDLLLAKLDDQSAIPTAQISMGLDLMYNALRATKRARSQNLRTRMKMLINLIKKFKLMDPEVVSRRALKNLVLIFVNIYTFQLDDDVQYTNFLEDSLLFAGVKGVSDTAMAFNDSTRNITDTDAMKSQVLDQVSEEGNEGEEEVDNLEGIEL